VLWGEAKSSFLIYVLYRYLFSLLIATLAPSKVDDFVQDSVWVNSGDDLVLGCIFLVFQIIACLVVFQATVSKESIRFNNGAVIDWGDVQYIVRFHNVYILKVKNEVQYYLFPVERQVIWLLGDSVKYTLMDQIIKTGRV